MKQFTLKKGKLDIDNSNLHYVNLYKSCGTPTFLKQPPILIPSIWPNFGTSTFFKKPSGIAKWYKLAIDLYFPSVKYSNVSGGKML